MMRVRCCISAALSSNNDLRRATVNNNNNNNINNNTQDLAQEIHHIKYYSEIEFSNLNWLLSIQRKQQCYVVYKLGSCIVHIYI